LAFVSPQHIEQMLFPFVHHELCGESLWILVPHAERRKLEAVVQEMVATRAAWLQRRGIVKKLPPAAAIALLSPIPFYSKNLFPPLSLLAKHQARYYRVTLKAGQVLMAHGGFAHFGFSTEKGETHSLASNMMTEHWLRAGGPEFLVRYFEWVLKLQAMPNGALDQELHACGLTHDQLANALNLCPPNFSCSLLRGMKSDLQRHIQGGSKRCIAAYTTLDIGNAQKAVALLERALQLLHEVRPLLEAYYVDPGSEQFQVCNCDDGSEGEAQAAESQQSGEEDDVMMEDDEETAPLQTPSVRRRRALAARRRLFPLSDSEDDVSASSAPARSSPSPTHPLPSAQRPVAAAIARPLAVQRKLDRHLASLLRLTHRPSQLAISSARYTPISAELCRCWYTSVAQALHLDSIWRVQQILQDAVAAIPTLGVAAEIGFECAHDASGTDLARLKRDFLRSDDFRAAQWGSDIEMHLLSYAYKGALSFLVYREQLPEPTSYRFSGAGAQPAATIEIALHWCRSRSRSQGRSAEPNHYNLLQYAIGAGLRQTVQPFWVVAEETAAHAAQRREHLCEASMRR
jgi:hypothetical protein